jgi:hypothetical protein
MVQTIKRGGETAPENAWGYIFLIHFTIANFLPFLLFLLQSIVHSI